jgi:pseudouridine synthase
MRLNRYIATYSGMSRRKADKLIEDKKVVVNRKVAHVGMQISEVDIIYIDGRRLQPYKRKSKTVLLHKPVGFVCSRNGQGNPSVYNLLRKSMTRLNIAGRLDKDSSGLVILTDDGNLIQELTHPKYDKEKVYFVKLERPITSTEIKKLKSGVNIGDDRLSKMNIKQIANKRLQIIMQEGRNRQIRRSFESIGHKVISLHRIKIGPYELGDLKPQQFKEI